MRGRKRSFPCRNTSRPWTIKKESPNEGTETITECRCSLYKVPIHKKRIPEWGDGNFRLEYDTFNPYSHKKRIPEWGDGNPTALSTVIKNWLAIKKESPNEGTETFALYVSIGKSWVAIKKESPNEGTETGRHRIYIYHLSKIKKESPNEGTETKNSGLCSISSITYKKRIPEWGDGNTTKSLRLNNCIRK